MARVAGALHDGLERERVPPVGPVVVVVVQRVTLVDEHLVEPDLVLGDADVTFLDVEWAQVLLEVTAAAAGPTGGPVQVDVGPAERLLDDSWNSSRNRSDASSTRRHSGGLVPTRSTRTR